MDKASKRVMGMLVTVFVFVTVFFFVAITERDTCRAELAECRAVTWCESEASDE